MYLKYFYSIALISFCLLGLLGGTALAQSPAIKGQGCTTATMIDWDCDGYGPGSPLGPDADDNDATVNTSASALAKYGSTAAILAHLGYYPTRMLFISNAGNDSTGQPNNQNLPYATWAGVSGLVQPGDAVIWRAGTYPMSAPVYVTSGTAATPNLYMAYPGEKVVLDWSAQGSDGVRGDGLSYWTLDGLILKGSASGYGIAEQQYSAVTNMTVRNVETTGWYDGVFFMNNMSNILIERSVFHDLATYGEHNLYIGASVNPSPNLIFRHNIVYKAGQGGGHNLHLNGRFPNALIQGNILYADLNQCIGIQNGVNHSTFENNICFTTANAPIFILDYYQNSNADIQSYDQNYNVFRNNTFYYDGTNYQTGATACNQYAFWVRDESAGSGSLSNPTNATHDLGHNTFDNNTFYTGCTGSSAAMRYDSDYNGNGGTKWLATDTWRNNAIYAAGGGYGSAFMLVGNYANTSYAPMTFAQFQSGNLGGATNSQSNPTLVAVNPAWYNTPQSFDFQLQAGSPAMGAGLASDAPATDIMGKPRGSTPDVGAYQSSGNGVTVPALIAGTTSLPGGTVGTGYSQALSASGGTAPYTWSIVSGSLPAGLSLSNGTIGGTPTTAGSPGFTAQVTDSASRTATAALSISITAPAPVAALSGLSCGASTLSSNASTTCTATMSAAAPAGGASVGLSSTCTYLTNPASVMVAAGSTSAAFTVTTGTISASQTGTITATYSSASKTTSISLTAAAPPGSTPAPPVSTPAPTGPALGSLQCTPTTLASGASATCTAKLSKGAPTGGAAIALSSNSTALTVPASVTVSWSNVTAKFTAKAGTISTGGSAVITATSGGVSIAVTVTLQSSSTSSTPPASSTGGSTSTSSTAALIKGVASEVTGTSNGSTVNPTVGVPLKLVVSGTGSVNFPSGGVSFKTGGQQNTNTAYYYSQGAQVGQAFNVNQGQIGFNLQSSYAFAAREALPQYNYRQVFDAWDNSQELFFFQVQAVYGRLSFYYNMGGTSGVTYVVPSGTEDALFGTGVAMNVNMVWDGSNMNLYLNGNLVNKTPYSKATPNWTSTASFTFGADDPHVGWGGGFYSCDDIIGNFQVQNPALGATN